MADSKATFLSGMGISEQQYNNGKLPDLIVKGEKPNTIRIAFRTKFAPSVSFNDFTMVTMSAADFDNVCKSLPRIWDEMKKEK